MKTLSGRLHPLLVIAALAVIVFSLAGAAAIFGRIPGAESRPTEPLTQNAISRDAAPSPGRSGSAERAAPALCADCGVIESIRVAQVEGQGSGLGAAAGGVTGAIIGNQIGHGSGRTIATIAGAAGGAYAGNAIEKNMKKHTVYRVTLRMDDGSLRTLSQREAPGYSVGDRVRVANGRITERA